jgi:transposase
MASHSNPAAEPTIWRIPDDLWAELQPLLPREKAPGTPGRPAVPYRTVLDGILYVLRTGCQWKAVPKEFGSGSTCHRRFQQWVADGTWKRLWVDQLRRYDAAHGIGWDWQSADSATVPSPPRRRRHGAGPHQPGQTRHQTPRPRRSARGTGERGDQRRQPHRHEAGGRDAGRHRRAAPPADPAAPPAPVPR